MHKYAFYDSIQPGPGAGDGMWRRRAARGGDGAWAILDDLSPAPACRLAACVVLSDPAKSLNMSLLVPAQLRLPPPPRCRRPSGQP